MENETVVMRETRKYRIWKDEEGSVQATVKVQECDPHALFHVRYYNNIRNFDYGNTEQASCDLAISILADYYGGGTKGRQWAGGLYEKFMKDVVSNHKEKEWSIDGKQIQEWMQ